MADWQSLEYRKKFLQDIKSDENKQRKAKSLQEYEIYNGNLSQYVQEYLAQQLSRKTVQKMPIISSIDICKRIVDQEASVYKTEPKREFVDVSDADKEVLELIYQDAMADVKLLKSNRYFKLQFQNLIQVLPKDGLIQLRVLFPHNYDIVPDEQDPEKADSVVISAFDKENYVQGDKAKVTGSVSFVSGNSRDNTNQTNADQDDYKSSLEKYVVWSKEYNFIMDGNGAIVSGEDTRNATGVLPFVDVAADKDFNYFVDRGSQLANFAIQYNAAISDLANIVRMQAYSQAVLKGAKEAMPEEIQVGPTTIIKLPIDANSPVETSFEFVSPSPDLQGSISFIELLISNFLSARGLSPTAISGKQQADKFTSGVDRFLSMIDRFEATKQDFMLYKSVEKQIFEIIKAMLLTYSNTRVLNKEYFTSQSIKNATLNIQYSKPEQAQSETDKLVLIRDKMELGLIDNIGAVMELYKFNESEAEEYLDKIKERSLVETSEPETNGTRSQPDIQS